MILLLLQTQALRDLGRLTMAARRLTMAERRGAAGRPPALSSDDTTVPGGDKQADGGKQPKRVRITKDHSLEELLGFAQRLHTSPQATLQRLGHLCASSPAAGAQLLSRKTLSRRAQDAICGWLRKHHEYAVRLLDASLQPLKSKAKWYLGNEIILHYLQTDGGLQLFGEQPEGTRARGLLLRMKQPELPLQAAAAAKFEGVTARDIEWRDLFVGDMRLHLSSNHEKIAQFAHECKLRQRQQGVWERGMWVGLMVGILLGRGWRFLLTGFLVGLQVSRIRVAPVMTELVSVLQDSISLRQQTQRLRRAISQFAAARKGWTGRLSETFAILVISVLFPISYWQLHSMLIGYGLWALGFVVYMAIGAVGGVVTNWFFGESTEVEDLMEAAAEEQAIRRRQESRSRAAIEEAAKGVKLASVAEQVVEELDDGVHFMPEAFRPIRTRIITFVTCVDLHTELTEDATVELRHESAWWSVLLARLQLKEVTLQGKINVWWDPREQVVLVALRKYAPLRLHWSSDLVLLPGILGGMPLPDLAEDSLPSLFLRRWLRRVMSFNNPLWISILAEENPIIEQECAVRVLQAHFRAQQARRQGKTVSASAVTLQAAVRGRRVRRLRAAALQPATRLRSLTRDKLARRRTVGHDHAPVCSWAEAQANKVLMEREKVFAPAEARLRRQSLRAVQLREGAGAPVSPSRFSALRKMISRKGGAD